MLIWMLAVACVPADVIRKNAEANGHQWLMDMGYEGARVVCVGRDSDNDGYVSCTVARGDGTRLSIECGYTDPSTSFFANTGCKERNVLSVMDGAATQ